MEKKLPVRSCAVCRTKKAQNELTRIGFNGSENRLYLGKGNGRAIYLCSEKSCFDLLKKRKNISRLLKSGGEIINFDEIMTEIEGKF